MGGTEGLGKSAVAAVQCGHVDNGEKSLASLTAVIDLGPKGNCKW